jgi:two-component system response regulator PilR (NtrC family)
MDPILVVDDDPGFRQLLAAILEREGYAVELAARVTEARAQGSSKRYSLVISDLKLPDGDGLDVQQFFLERSPETPFVLITAFGTVATAVEALKRGALDYLEKPLRSPDELRRLVRRALALSASGTETPASAGPRPATPGLCASMVARDPRMLHILDLLEKVAPTPANVLLLGESGVGKEVLARCLHQHSHRADKPFVAVNCAALSPTLIESELFGHERGAFTGAVARRHGVFERARGGTLFLDEVGEMPLTIQTKFLKALEEQKIWRVGGRRPVQIDVNIVAATNKDLAQAVQRGEFREDLFYRLNVVPIALPPLRERGEDILLLAAHFLEVSQARYRRSFKGLTEGAKHRLLTYDWPGNIRELRNCVERAVILETGPYITEASLGLAGEPAPARTSLPVPLPGVDSPEAPIPDSGFDLESLLNTIECGYLKKALQQCDGNQSQAARLLGMTRDNFRYRLKKYGLGEAVSEPVATGGPKG